MDDEFKLCWKNFQDNIASGFQNLYDRGDLVDVTLACDGKLLHAHKIVLAICSPYFQEIFITNPCKHPIIILKDVTFNIMCELLEFMYQGVVNVKHTELQSFMKIGQLLQIKGLATNVSSTTGSTPTDKSASQTHNNDETSNVCAELENNTSASVKTTPKREAIGDNANTSEVLENVKITNPISIKSHSPPSSPSPMGFDSTALLNQPSFKSSPENNVPLHQSYHHAGANLKRHSDLNSDALSIYSRKQFRRSIASAEHNTDHSDSADADADSDYFISSLPHLATNSSAAAAAAAFRGTFNPAAFGFDYNLYKGSGATGVTGSGIGGVCGSNTAGSSGQEYPNDLHIPSDYSKNFGNHVDIPPNSSNVVMLSSTSLLHGNCVFNRNNTVATQQGMKTYWLCKSYRISMCRARCITHQGRVISATGVHNHPPHMRGSGPGGGGAGNGASGGNLSGSTSGAGFSIDANVQQSTSVPSSISPSISLNSINMSGTLLPGGNNAASGMNAVTGTRLHHTTVSSVIGASMYQPHNSMHNSPSQQLQLHQNQQQQQQMQHQHQQQPLHSVGGSISPPPIGASLMSSPHGRTHCSQSATSLLMSHNSTADSGSSHINLHHHHHHHPHHHQQHVIGSSGNGQGSNRIIQNLLHSANASNVMHHSHHSQLPHTMAHLTQHQHHSNSHEQLSQQHQPHLEITPLMQSPPLPPPPTLHLQSPSNQSNQSQHGSGGANSLSSPLTTTPVIASSSSTLKSPAQTSLSDEAICVSEVQSHQSHSAHLSGGGEQQQHLLSHHGATLSPSELNSNTAVSSHSKDGTSEAQHQAHVIDSITISPAEGHNFKMEDM
ncbi:PREDICTED: broad-complex core protein isoforms 1/2/3/4/5-like [Rhagoletis zephyria]|uniref:broad-complex core protein isoforms 1/2/3/4/5-like n=1 Tax=Rhagoletis zephyria TaxID=28612 RepID=UPI0008116291|nr:PREDICTED: broad-complex core protein isoforms 1/2/3/4/5-like [Rhagoletis zephyria]